MKLSEIAEHIVKYHPDCCMSINNEITIGCREDWYEQYLIKILMDYYMYEYMDLCVCGIPEYTYEAIRNYLRIRKDFHSCEDISKFNTAHRYLENLHIDKDDDYQYGMLQFMMYILDSYGFTEHGSGIGGCWLTEDGERLLTVLDAWYEMENK